MSFLKGYWAVCKAKGFFYRSAGGVGQEFNFDELRPSEEAVYADLLRGS